MSCIYFGTVFNNFVSKLEVTQNIFTFRPRHWDRSLIVVLVYYFQIWNKKEHHIIINRVHMGPMNIETPFRYPSLIMALENL